MGDFRPRDVVTDDERRMIDEAIAAGRVQIIPRGVESDPRETRRGKISAIARARGTAARRRKHAIGIYDRLLKRRMALQGVETGAT